MHSPAPAPHGYVYHKLTSSEMESLRGDFGVRDPDVDYNVMVDGFGTGLAPPTSDGWSSLVGELNVVDSVPVGAAETPSSVDLSQEPTFPRVGNQAAQPSCAAWATTYYAYGFLEAKDRDWVEAKQGNHFEPITPESKTCSTCHRQPN